MIKLEHSQLNVIIDAALLDYEADVGDSQPAELIGQDRAVKALEFGLKIKTRGFNIYACGMPGSGKTTFAKKYAEKTAASEEIPPDLCYVYNFKNPKEPRLLTLPPGNGVVFKAEMDELTNRLSIELPRIFGSKSFDIKKSELMKRFYHQKDELFRRMSDEARKKDFGVKTSNSGIYFFQEYPAAARRSVSRSASNSSSVSPGNCASSSPLCAA